MMNIMELPPELLSAIASTAQPRDIPKLRLVCKAFAGASIDIALRRIVVDTSGSSEIEGCRMDVLRTLAEVDEHHLVRVLARSLEIKRWSPGPGQQVEAVGHLEAICRNLTQVESLIWSWGSFHPSSGALNRSTDVVQALRPMIACLREVDLLAFQPDQAPILEDLSLLTRFFIQPHGYLPVVVATPVWKQAVKVIERSQDTLQDLFLYIIPDNSPKLSIQDVLWNNNRPTSFPRLTSLALYVDLAIRSKSTTLPQLSSLQSLSLLGGIEESDSWPQAKENIFVALRQSGIRLRRVCAPQSTPLLDYLESYDGILQDVEIEDPEEPMTETDDRKALAMRFFQKIVPKHQSSLQGITMISDEDDGWAFGDVNTSMFIGPLPMLESLRISIRMAGVDHHLKTFLDSVLRPSHFPRLRRIELYPERSKSYAQAAFTRLRGYLLTVGREADAGLVMNWIFPRLFVETCEFGPCFSGGLLHFEPVGKSWDILHDHLTQNGWKWWL
ncbi:hypothetical protein BKA70DRAFT_829787 [Coprinopsis sp. MPI-PUGE-AT-0042]|nr:hypothetical protein BKA70DRAFT_829787 [Coprinopsis sp. MPI-PUGE-AT-0042]